MTYASDTDRSPERPRLLTRATRAWLPKPTAPATAPEPDPAPATADLVAPSTIPTAPAAPTAQPPEPTAGPADLVEPAADPTAPAHPTAPADHPTEPHEAPEAPEAPAERPRSEASIGPRLVPPFVDAPSVPATPATPGADSTPGASGTSGTEPASAPTLRPRLAAVSLPEAPRGAARRRELPRVRAVRLGGTPREPEREPASAERRPASDGRPPAAVTPVPLPLPRAAGTTAVPNESRTEEPQP
ncbi:hypothetical protein HHL19_26295 [Streptomyces sp. R302]|uniref:hypothetical protein n=1 Tax=unclassified Streptomyces TaxID=2593676 RepID=UPI00145D68A2|nr:MULTISPECIES: hypothetical protein [unclassified Streptomyces]NML55551.1 hypothetical protein [Streptomyces sp. R301]NML82068.1 hypothetical protein [Streptomyces sp. R302]